MLRVSGWFVVHCDEEFICEVAGELTRNALRTSFGFNALRQQHERV